MQLARLAESYLQPSDAFDCRRLTKQWWSSWCFCWLFLRIQICPKKGTFPYNPILGMGSWILLFGGVLILWLWHKGFVQLQKLLKRFFLAVEKFWRHAFVEEPKARNNCIYKGNLQLRMTLLILLTSMKCCMILGKSERPQPRSPQMMFWKGNPPKVPLIQVFEKLYYFTQMKQCATKDNLVRWASHSDLFCLSAAEGKSWSGPFIKGELTLSGNAIDMQSSKLTRRWNTNVW